MSSDADQFGYRIAATAFANFSAAAGATLAEMNQKYPGVLDDFLDGLERKIGDPPSVGGVDPLGLPRSERLALSRIHQMFRENATQARDSLP